MVRNIHLCSPAVTQSCMPLNSLQDEVSDICTGQVDALRISDINDGQSVAVSVARTVKENSRFGVDALLNAKIGRSN